MAFIDSFRLNWVDVPHDTIHVAVSGSTIANEASLRVAGLQIISDIDCWLLLNNAPTAVVGDFDGSFLLPARTFYKCNSHGSYNCLHALAYDVTETGTVCVTYMTPTTNTGA